MAKRKSRNKIKVKDKEMLKPLNIEDFGTENDPCFGKLYDLSTPECKRCGDSEICGIVFAQKLNKDRSKVEDKNRFKDIELEITDYITNLQIKGYKESKIIRLTKKKFNITRKEVKDRI